MSRTRCSCPRLERAPLGLCCLCSFLHLHSDWERGIVENHGSVLTEEAETCYRNQTQDKFKMTQATIWLGSLEMTSGDSLDYGPGILCGAGSLLMHSNGNFIELLVILNQLVWISMSIAIIIFNKYLGSWNVHICVSHIITIFWGVRPLDSGCERRDWATLLTFPMP